MNHCLKHSEPSLSFFASFYCWFVFVCVIFYLGFFFVARPVITSVTSNLNVVEGDQLEVECDFTSIPFPEVSWLKDDQPLTGQGDGIRISTSRSNNTGQAIVTIVSATLSNNGMYTCIIKNPAASVNRTVEIQVTKSKQQAC